MQNDIVNVSRVLLERLLSNDGGDGRYDLTEWNAARKELHAILAQPAEAERVEVVAPVVAWLTDWPGTRVYADAPHGFDEPGLRLTGDAIAECWEALVRQADHLAALASVTAERDRLRKFEAAYMEWQDKTDWVQQTAQARELGKHRADALKERIDQLRAEVEALRDLLSKSIPVVEAHAGASHMLEGFRPIRNKWDELVDGIRAALAAKEGV